MTDEEKMALLQKGESVADQARHKVKGPPSSAQKPVFSAQDVMCAMFYMNMSTIDEVSAFLTDATQEHDFSEEQIYALSDALMSARPDRPSSSTNETND